MRTFGVPKILLLIMAEDFSSVGDEVCDIVEFISVFLDDGAGDNADVELFCESAVCVKVFLGLGAEIDEGGFIGEPVG